MSSTTQQEKIINHRGPVKFDTIGDLISLLKERMLERKVKQVVYKKVLMIMIESLENIFRYNDQIDHKKVLYNTHPPEFSIIKDNKKFVITCSNPLLQTDVKLLEKRLKYIISLDKNGVKELYKKTITDGQFSEKGGAGLGLIEMAKLSDEDLKYRFKKIDKTYAFYILEMVVNEP